MNNMKVLKFLTDSIEMKTTESVNTGEKNYYVEGYISTSELDQGNDIVTIECLKDMVEQLKSGNLKIDIEHETWKKKDFADIAVGRIIDAVLDDTRLKVVVMINKNHSRFKEVWGSLKDKFLDAFSIAFDPNNIDFEEVDDGNN